MKPRVLFVSKSIAPPFRDGTKCLVRDVALHLSAVTPVLMSTPDAPPLEQVATRLPAEPDDPPPARAEMVSVYARDSGFSPALRDNARVALHLLTRAQADLWHFVFAPNPRTSRIARVLARVRRVPVVQTVASPPRQFAHIERLLFGDAIVAQSRWTAEQLQGALPSGRELAVEIIPPPVGALRLPSPDEIDAQRHELDLAPGAPVFVYPGDLEVSGGAEAVAAMATEVARELPDAVFVFACRVKTPDAPRIARALVQRLGAARARFTSDPTDLLALLAGATAVLFPVDDLWGKVDLPIVLLETMALGAPVVAFDHGPLGELEGAWLVPPYDDAALVRAALDLARDSGRRERVVRAQREAVSRRFSARVVARAYERVYEELLRRSELG